MDISLYRDSPEGRLALGSLHANDDGSDPTFLYDATYLISHQSTSDLGISTRLPLTGTPYSNADITPFLQGLLPEGDILGNLAQMYQVARGNWPKLLQHLGCESIGALTFIAEGENPGDFEPKYETLTAKDIEAFRRNPTRAATQTASSTRLSLSGAQSKVAWTLPNGIDAARATQSDWLVPRGTAASTHIIKMSRKGEEELARNELACSVLARSCGIESAEVTLIDEIPGAIAIKRYDRFWEGTDDSARVARTHQEDFCQALGLSPFYKYQPEGIEADYIEFAADLIDSASDSPAADKLEFAKRLAFSYAIGNSDAHLKNSSLLYNVAWTGRRLAPMYDVTCIPLSGYSTRMPFVVGEHRQLNEIDERDILSIALSMDISVEAFCDKVHEVTNGLEGQANSLDDETLKVAAKILDNAAPRIKVLRTFLG